MTSFVTDNSVEGDLLIVSHMCEYLKYTRKQKDFILSLTRKGLIDVGTLVEEAMLSVGEFQRSFTGRGEDFDDQSDSKKVVVSLKDNTQGTRAATIGNIDTKIGYLRVVAADPFSGDIHFFLIPNHEIVGKHNIKISFGMDGNMPERTKRGSFSWRCWNVYKVGTFEELCKKVPKTNSTNTFKTTSKKTDILENLRLDNPNFKGTVYDFMACPAYID